MYRASTILATLVLALVVGTPALAQEPNTSGSMTLNGVETGSYPIDAPLLTPSTLNFAIAGSPTSAWQPFALFLSSDVVAAGLPVAGEFVDIDLPSINVVLDGTNPLATPLNFFAFMDGAGNATVSLPITPQITSPTLVGGFQALLFNPTAPFGFNLSAATRLTLLPPPSFGTVHYSRGPAFGNHAAFSTTAPNAGAPNTAMPTDFDVENMRLAGFQHYHATNSHPWWRKDFASLPAGTTAMNINDNSTFPYIKTKHGDLYHFQDNTTTPNQYGYALAGPAGLAPLASTMIPTSGTSTWIEMETEVAVHENRLAYVVDPNSAASPNDDRMMLASLDGPTLSGGVEAVDISSTIPVVPIILEESLTFTANNLFYVGNILGANASVGEALFSAPSDGSAISQQVAIPTMLDPMGMPVVPDFIDAEMRYSEDRSMFVFTAGTAYNNEDLYVILDAGPGLYAPINLTMFPTPVEIEEFYDASVGLGKALAISPSNLRVAFVTREASGDELYVVDLASPGVLTHVSGASNMASSWDETIELFWATDDTLVFWAGEGSNNSFDLCAFTVSTGILQNITQTSGSGTLPLSGTPNIDVDKNFPSPNRTHLFWERDNGTDALGNATLNWIALDLATLALTDITGNEFAGGTAPHCDQINFDIQYARSSETLVFSAQDSTGTEDNVYVFTGGPVPTSAISLTNNLGTSGSQVDNLSINDIGSSVAFGDNISGQELLYRANTSSANSAAVVYTPAASVVSGDLTDGSIIWTGVDQFLFAYGSSSTSNPIDATLLLHDGLLGNLIIDANLNSYWIY